MVRPTYAGGIGKGIVPEGYTNYRQKKNMKVKASVKRSACIAARYDAAAACGSFARIPAINNDKG